MLYLGLSPHIGRMGIGFIPFDGLGLFVDAEYNSRQFYRGDENNEGKQVPGYFLLNASLEYTVPRVMLMQQDLVLLYFLKEEIF